MQRVVAGRLIIDAIKDRFGVADVVKWCKFRAVEKASTAARVDHQEVTPLCAADSKGRVFAECAERAVVRVETAGWLLTESGAGHGVDDQSGFVAVFRARRACNQFEGLKGIRRQLRGERLILLIADRLAVYHICRLAVISLGMKEAVGISDYSAGRQCDGIAESLPR